MRRGLLPLLLAALLGSRAFAATLALPADQFWIVIASRQDIDQAIGLARHHRSAAAKVVRSTNGWYAVVQGPRKVLAGTGAASLATLVKAHEIPGDAYLSKGDRYVETVWTPPAPAALETVHFDGRTDATLQDHGLLLTLSKVQVGSADEQAPVARGEVKGKSVFSIRLDDNPAEVPGSDASLVVLDKTSPAPQVVFTYFWQGAHCCTVTRIVTERPDHSWAVVAGEDLEGGGYDFEDLDGSGEQALVSDDNAFFYAFDSFAASVAPIRIHRLIGDKLVDVTTDPRFHHRLLQELASIESASDAESQHGTGYLAGWVAAKILVGQGPEAWSRMLASYVDNPDFGPDRCADDSPVEQCPPDRKRHVPFPIALKGFLIAHHYIGDPALYPLPDRLPPRPVR